jgi:hypothetical protein
MLRVIFLFAFAAAFFHFFCAIGRRFRKFIFSHFPDAEHTQFTGWIWFAYYIKLYLVIGLLGAVTLVLAWCVLYAQYNFNWFEW